MKGPRKAIIHVNQVNIRKNLKTGSREPVITVLAGKSNTKAHAVEIYDAHGSCIGRFVYSPDKPLSCGARLWFEADLTKVKLVLDTRQPVETVRCGSDDIVVSNTFCQALES